MSRFSRIPAVLAAALALSSLAWGQTPAVKVDAAWARVTVPGQKGTGAFMTLTAAQGLRLVGVQSPVAGITEIHEMKMEGDVMRMRTIAALDLPAGQAVAFRPGSYHLMLMDLKQPLIKDSQIPLTLRFQDAQGKPLQMQLSLPVLLAAPAGAAQAQHGAGHGNHKGH
ncbi:MAG: copper chaperone PCu(A)C [Betaproteobacteria bacterium]